MAGFWDLPAPEDLPARQSAQRIGEIRHTITHHHYTLEVRRRAALRRHPTRSIPLVRTGTSCGAIPLSTTARKALQLAGI